MVYHQDYKLYPYNNNDIKLNFTDNQKIGEKFIYDKNNINSKIELNLIIRMLNGLWEDYDNGVDGGPIFCKYYEDDFCMFDLDHEHYETYFVYRLYEKEVLVGYYVEETFFRMKSKK